MGLEVGRDIGKGVQRGLEGGEGFDDADANIVRDGGDFGVQATNINADVQSVAVDVPKHGGGDVAVGAGVLVGERATETERGGGQLGRPVVFAGPVHGNRPGERAEEIIKGIRIGQLAQIKSGGLGGPVAGITKVGGHALGDVDPARVLFCQVYGEVQEVVADAGRGNDDLRSTDVVLVGEAVQARGGVVIGAHKDLARTIDKGFGGGRRGVCLCPYWCGAGRISRADTDHGLGIVGQRRMDLTDSNVAQCVRGVVRLGVDPTEKVIPGKRILGPQIIDLKVTDGNGTC